MIISVLFYFFCLLGPVSINASWSRHPHFTCSFIKLIHAFPSSFRGFSCHCVTITGCSLSHFIFFLGLGITASTGAATFDHHQFVINT